MLPFEDRYTRQRQLVEVGLEGQARLETAPFELAGSELLSPRALIVATDYLRRAGVPVRADVTNHNPEATPPEAGTTVVAHFRFDGPTQVAAGALTALEHIRSVLGLTPSARSSVGDPHRRQ